ncbi:MAG TPA: lytic murein transglycosylase [Vicinamibacterales bacterium]|nr:lytic murein transglycosylase [Vicinamibacterales bacterium]
MIRPSALVRVAVPLLAAVWCVAGSTPLVARQDAVPARAAAVADDRGRFTAFLEEMKTEAVARGISAAVAARALDGLEPLPVVVDRDRGQAEAVLSIDTYVRRRLTPRTIRTARRMFTTHRAMLDKVGRTYGVQPRYLVAVWGLESNFGAFTGVRPTVQALATLAFDGRRGELFRNELFDALRIVERGHADLDRMKGSWAGAMGQPQFMPSSYLKYAEDFDGDGRRDIWSSQADVFASIANYLKAYGWDEDATWGRQVRLPGTVPDTMARAGSRGEGCRAERALSQRRLLAEWQAMGVRAVGGGALPKVDRLASLLDAGDRQFLVYSNYEAILGYNCANAYALSVAMLGDRISARP